MIHTLCQGVTADSNGNYRRRGKHGAKNVTEIKLSPRSLGNIMLWFNNIGLERPLVQRCPPNQLKFVHDNGMLSFQLSARDLLRVLEGRVVARRACPWVAGNSGKVHTVIIRSQVCDQRNRDCNFVCTHMLTLALAERCLQLASHCLQMYPPGCTAVST
jgi:hypothetical protein